ncbi:PAS domain S-box-containing protein [Dongia mobilis]|uniref:histidine kinase n=1 Tax=Dongia mobilis TaxID=578943 RepID=A0A4R6WLW2_9PROT|nr:PAS-domain containing protein [Dongia mobilis]TDQ81952.1 PAS domain S-box-containing protein [Dongia mobilis]
MPFGVGAFLVVGIYFLLARAGLAFAQLQESASPIWPASGFAVAALTLLGPRFAPAIFLAALAANWFTGGLVTALPIALGNTLEALAGAWLITRLGRIDRDLLPLTRMAGITAAALLASLVSAAIGTASLALAGVLDDLSRSAIAFTWWAGDALGILLLTPLLLALAERNGARAVPMPGDAIPAQSWLSRIPAGRRSVIAAALLFALALALLVVIHPVAAPALFLALPAFALVAWLAGGLLAHLALLILAAIWLVATSSSAFGPFTGHDLNAAIIDTQILLAGFAIGTMTFAELRAVRSPLPLLVFTLGCVIAGITFAALRYEQQRIDARHLINVAERVQQQIANRMGIYVNALRGGASLYAASRSVNRQEWRDYAQSLDMPRHYPGVLGIGVVLPGDKASATSFTYAMRRDGRPDFTIHPVPGVDPEAAAYTQHFTIVYIVPEEPNQAAIGLDLASEPNRRLAALKARDSGNPAMTARIILVQDAKRQPGFLVFVPIYRQPGGATDIETLRWYFHGWIYAPFLAADFFSHAMITESAELRLRIHDGPDADPAELVFDSGTDPAAPFRASHRSRMYLLGHEFTLEWQESPLFDRQDPFIPTTLSAGGLVFASLLAALVAALLSQKDRAQYFADRMSAALALANERFELAVDCSQDVIWDHNIRTDQIWSSPRMAQLYGWGHEDIRDRYWEFWQQVMGPETYADFRRQYDELVAGKRDDIDAVFRCRHRDGRPLYVQTRCRSLRDADGKVVRVIGVDTDITLVKQLEIRLRDAISVMEDGFGLFDADDRVVLYNDRFIDEGTRKVIGDPTGHTFEEILRAFAYNDMPVTDPAFDREAWIEQRLGRHRNPPEEPIEVTWGDGRIMRISERRTSDGGYVGIWTDVTEIKRLGQRLEAAIGTITDGFALYDAEDRLIIANDSFITPTMRRHFGERVNGISFTELYRAYGEIELGFSGEALETWFARRLELHRNPPPDPFEVAMPDGRVLRVFERRTGEGGTVGTWTDITALRRAEQRLKDAIESINEGFLLLDADGRYVVFNSQLLKLYPKTAPHVAVGGSFAEALRKGAEAGEYPHLDTPEQIDAFVAEWSGRFRDKTPFQGAAPLAGGGWVLVSHRPTAEGGSVNIYTDITDLKARESDLAEANIRLQQQAQALTLLAEELRAANLAAEQANISKSQFLANMSHELRTPLNGIIGFSDIIRRELFGQITPARYRDYAEDIHQSGAHLLNLINDILDLSKIEAGKMSLRIAAIPTDDAVAQAQRMVQPLADSRRITLHPPVIEDCPLLHADERQLKQILLNLLSNAVKFTPEGGEVRVAIRSDGDAGAVITIADTGIGMSPDEIRIALERFGQADSSLAKSTPGTGLGLPLVDGLVKLHDGRLEIASEKGQGTTVTVRLPWHKDLQRSV